jgi:uncharacterized protein
MFVEMRRKDREMTAEETLKLLAAAEYGVMTVVGRNGYPHPVPMSYAWKDGAIWLHCAKAGSKLDDIRADAKVSFCVVGNTEVLPEKFSTNYSSAIVFGDIAEVSGKEAEAGLLALVEKYSPGFLAEGKAYVSRAASDTCVLRIDVRHMTGKARR